MKLSEIIGESAVSYTVQPTKRFWLVFAEPTSFKQLTQDKKFLAHAGPHTTFLDVSDVEDVKLSPGENKWNAMKRLYSNDEDEITCSNSGVPTEWVCLAINVSI